jgi:molybdate transport system ATP-binding protein
MEESDLPKVRDVFGDDITRLNSVFFSPSFNIGHLLDIELTRLSNGQLKKVLIIKHLLRNIPQVLLLDYPFDGLDLESRKDLSAFISRLADKFKIQIILVDHDNALPSVINKRLLLHDFKIASMEDVERETPAEQINPTPEANTPAAANGVPVVEMQGLTIAYGGKKIIENLHWRISKGERWALTGKNGSGKTTLFSLIFADHPMAYSQKVFLFGKRRGSGESIWDIKRRINYLGPEQIHFLSPQTVAMSAREYIYSQGKKEPQLLQKLVGFFGAETFIDNPVRFLSSGQLQITLLMNFFLHEKELLLLDEPFQFLDPQNREKATRYLTRFLNEQITLVLITHNETDVHTWTQLRKTL